MYMCICVTLSVLNRWQMTNSNKTLSLCPFDRHEHMQSVLVTHRFTAGLAVFTLGVRKIITTETVSFFFFISSECSQTHYQHINNMVFFLKPLVFLVFVPTYIYKVVCLKVKLYSDKCLLEFYLSAEKKLLVQPIKFSLYILQFSPNIQ